MNYVKIYFIFNLFLLILEIQESSKITNLIILGNYYK